MARNRDNEAPGFPFPRRNSNTDKERAEGLRRWGILMFGAIGAAATAYAVRFNYVHFRVVTEDSSPMSKAPHWRYSAKQGGPNRSQQSNQSRDDAWTRYNQRIQEEYEEEMERVERIRRMQGVFNRERERYKRSYEKWYENASDAYQQHNFQRDDWYWKTDKSDKERAEKARRERMRAHGNYGLSHHYEVLGLDTSRVQPYSDAEIKAAFRNKAMQYHPDQNLDNKEAAEAKFKQVMVSYEALKAERKAK
eukprot:TRINITY_DN17510_c0_g1_i3.p1 TRINITY_DN17510_c0_g1~~TRINITY_DN17510_c0_g1_i3.p1  ORF type:complete len:250 (-),score=52.51 TRINITY_DN17510_c0_g1_i3:608-1357(-)